MSQRIARYRGAKGWSGKQLAAKSGMDPARISEYENEARNPQFKQLQRIALTASDPQGVLRWLQDGGLEPSEIVYGGLPATVGGALDPVVATAVGEMVQAVQRGVATGAFILEWAERLYAAGRAGQSSTAP